MELTKLPNHAVSGTVVEQGSGAPIPNAPVFIRNDNFEYETVADANGNFTVQSVIEGDYIVYAGAWGYVNTSLNTAVFDNPVNFTIELSKGYADDFIVDLGWNVEGDAQTGMWERDVPVGTTNGNNTIFPNPDADIDGDLGDKCYVTGNSGVTHNDDDIDNGYTLLSSPSMDLTSMNAPVVKYTTWFFNGGNVGT